MSGSDDVLRLIDRTLDDVELGPDAMRSVPDDGTELPECRHDGCPVGGPCERPHDAGNGLFRATAPAAMMMTQGRAWVYDPDADPDGEGRDRPALLGPGWREITAELEDAPAAGMSDDDQDDQDDAGGEPLGPGWQDVGWVDESASWEALGRPPLPGPLAHLTLDRHGAVVSRYDTDAVRRAMSHPIPRVDAAEVRRNLARAIASVDVAAVNRDLSRVGAHAHAMAEALRPAVQRVNAVFAALRQASSRAAGGEVTRHDDAEPADPWQTALEARRNRNTGPPRDPHRHRGMR